jgi:hypothetical protein
MDSLGEGNPFYRVCDASQTLHVTILKINSTVGSNQAHYKVKGGGFTSAIWAQKADYLAFVHMDIDSIDDRTAAVDLNQLIRTENRLLNMPLCFYNRRCDF